MSFRKAVKSLNECFATQEAARTIYKQAMDVIEADFGKTGRLHKEKQEEARSILNQSISQANEKAAKECKEAFEQAKKTVKEHITKPVPEGFTNTLEAIRAMGSTLSKEEAKAYLEQYKGNYAAYKGLVNVVQEQIGETFHVKSYEEVMENIDRMEGRIANQVLSSRPSEYMVAIFSSEKSSPLLDLGEMVAEFLGTDIPE
jgi:hypothetical protein